MGAKKSILTLIREDSDSVVDTMDTACLSEKQKTFTMRLVAYVFDDCYNRYITHKYYSEDNNGNLFTAMLIGCGVAKSIVLLCSAIYLMYFLSITWFIFNGFQWKERGLVSQEVHEANCPNQDTERLIWHHGTKPSGTNYNGHIQYEQCDWIRDSAGTKLYSGEISMVDDIARLRTPEYEGEFTFFRFIKFAFIFGLVFGAHWIAYIIYNWEDEDEFKFKPL